MFETSIFKEHFFPIFYVSANIEMNLPFRLYDMVRCICWFDRHLTYYLLRTKFTSKHIKQILYSFTK